MEIEEYNFLPAEPKMKTFRNVSYAIVYTCVTIVHTCYGYQNQQLWVKGNSLIA